jgi:hypothetical protein
MKSNCPDMCWTVSSVGGRLDFRSRCSTRSARRRLPATKPFRSPRARRDDRPLSGIRGHLDDVQRRPLHEVQAGSGPPSSVRLPDDGAQRRRRADPSEGDASHFNDGWTRSTNSSRCGGGPRSGAPGRRPGQRRRRTADRGKPEDPAVPRPPRSSGSWTTTKVCPPAMHRDERRSRPRRLGVRAYDPGSLARAVRRRAYLRLREAPRRPQVRGVSRAAENVERSVSSIC